LYYKARDLYKPFATDANFAPPEWLKCTGSAEIPNVTCCNVLRRTAVISGMIGPLFNMEIIALEIILEIV
jgi:hypothetical protein